MSGKPWDSVGQDLKWQGKARPQDLSHKRTIAIVFGIDVGRTYL
jgi:hypothetical protein